MAHPTIHDIQSSLQQRADSPFAQATLSADFEQIVVGAATRPERGVAGFNPNVAAPTIRQQNSDNSASDDDYNSLLEDYEILEKLCVGAEAQLFIARRLYDNEQVVLKIYHPGISPSEEVVSRVKRVPHDHVVRILDFGRLGVDGQFYEVQEYISGDTLTHVLGSHPLDEYSCLLVLQQSLYALAHLHTPDAEGFSIVHRDIKPDNILFQLIDGQPNFLFCDFGIARSVSQDSELSLAVKSCTPRYAAPETYDGIISIKVDFWSLGMVLLEAATGRHPFAGMSEASIESHIRTNWKPDLAYVQSSPWRDLLDGLLKHDPAERWGHAEVEAWLAAEMASEEVTDDESSDDISADYSFLHSTTPEELAARLAFHWYQVALLLDVDLFRRWLEQELSRVVSDKPLADMLDDADPSSDIRLLRLIYRIYPELPLGWKEWSLIRADFADICRHAVAGNNSLNEMIQELFNLDVLTELALLTGDDDLLSRSTRWKNAVADFSEIRNAMECLGAPESLLPKEDHGLPKLYLFVCEGEEIAFTDTEVTALLVCCYPWLEVVKQFSETYSPVQKYIKAVAMASIEAEHRNNFKVTHDLNATAASIDSEQVRLHGWIPPTIQMTAEHIDYSMTVLKGRTTVAKGVRLSWNVRRAAVVYLTRFGLVGDSGQRPHERVSSWELLFSIIDYIRQLVPFFGQSPGSVPAWSTTRYFIDSCQCNQHNASWYTIGETTTFSLVAIGLGGICVHRLPPIVVPPPVLEQQAQLAVETPELLDQIEVTDEVPEFVPRLELLQTEILKYAALGRADLPPQLELNIQALGKDDLQQQEQFAD